MAGISGNTFFLLVLLALIIMVWFQVNSLGNKIFCTFRRKDKSKEEKFISLKDDMVNFGKGLYEVDPRRITILKYKRGIIGALFAIPVRTLDFTWASRVAENPDDFSTTWDTPDARAMADSKSDWKGMNQGIDTQTGKKQGIMGGWMVWVAVIAIVLIAFFTYQNYTHVKSIEKYLQAGGGTTITVPKK
jgi:hypothetical protein